MISEAGAATGNGREREIEEIEHLLERNRTRVLCIVGESGAGKTRLANAVVAHATARYDHTVSIYLPPQGLLNSAEDLLLSSLLNQLLPIVPRYLSPEAL